MDNLQIRLAGRFRKQQEFTAGYSPLYSRLFGLVADWLTTPPDHDPLADWLLQVGATRASFDVPLLLLAGLHREILSGVNAVSDLARYYPTVGGTLPADDDQLADHFQAAILARQPRLDRFIRTATVQTNETARGLCWLLPVLLTRWPAIHLVDLGASAGLNLVADQRHYRLDRGGDTDRFCDLGNGEPVQFLIANSGQLPWLPRQCSLPAILSRTGCDLAPFALTTTAEEQTLASFVWGDQTGRLARLRQGINALHRTEQTAAPVRLHRADLPDDLSRFLAQQITPYHDAPVVIYNTYLTTYLHDKGASLRPQLAVWAAKQTRPVLWLQWETLWQGPKPPDFGWVGWTADLWQDGRHVHWHLAWAHPHGTRIQWLPESADWADFWRDTLS
jgi:hypothetical protein